MRIVFVNFYSGIAQRGGETFVDSLATELAAKEKVFVFQSGKATKKSYHQIQKQIEIDMDHPHGKLPVTHVLKRLFLDYFSLKILLFTIRSLPAIVKIKPDYIYPLNSGWQVLILTLLARITGAKIVIGGHSGPGWNDRVNLLFHPDIFIALTKTQADWAKKATIWKNQKIVIIPNGVDTRKFSPHGTKRALSLKKPIVLAVGAPSKSKRLSATIEAVAKLKDVSLLVCGTGPQNTVLDNLGSKLLGKRYQRLSVSQEDMPSVYRACDTFTLCSDSSEAFGIVYLEALASGLPCVGTDDASRREILGTAGIFVTNPEDPDEYAQKLQLALAQKTSEKYIIQAQKHSWKKIAEKYHSILKQL